MSDFAKRYGPWAVVLGASDGTGAALAREIAAQGVACVLVARREVLLRELADQIFVDFGIECIVATIDLSSSDACKHIVDVVGDKEVGLFVSNAGADSNGSRFLDAPIDNWIQLANINISTILQCCHHFATLMRHRKRGGVLLVSSGACYGGGGFMATYSGAKAFQLCFAESLWSELKPCGVDVLLLALGTTDTPSFRKLLEEKGKKPPGHLASPAEVARVAMARLDKGPVFNWGQRLGLRAGWRKWRVKLISYLSRKMVFE